ncbi:flagellar hook protein FlgE [Sphingomonas sp.]|uniref:flagellar hook protein FlgE n=1 Tax=Sphingomonas sp. TaxID=28214 RepID=UPI001EC092F0|nr:flagellar hook protein FlgE [Sphingomonas sp.]MBX3595317.1 flagellar hook protein FlgE [Sphingomonas sp.]
MSFFTSLSGLQAAQTDMSTISHNLSNVSTNGFKKSRTEFADVIASSVSLNPNQMVGSGTVVKAIRQQFGQGGLQQSASSLDVAIAGDGFFAVKPSLEAASVNFTRNGSFLVDSDRYVTDSQGGYLQVYPVDGSGAVVATGLGSTVNLRLPQTSGVPEATKNVALALNLSAYSSVPSEATRFTAATPYAFDRFDPGTYNNSTQTTIYDASGNPLTMTNYFVRETTTTPSTWSVYSFVGDKQLAVDNANPAPVTLTFDANGAMTSPTSATQFAPVTVGTSTSEQTISLDFGTATTQLGAPFSINARTQDGKAVGQLDGVTVGEDGIVRASFSNGDSQALGKVALANFANPSGLRQLGNSTWAATGLSGEPRLGEAGVNGFGGLMAGAIERSNVDITEELVGLIAAQRNFQANAKALDTASQISQTIFNIRS